MKQKVSRIWASLALGICLLLMPCVRVLLPASAGDSRLLESAAMDGADPDTTLCTLTAGYATPIGTGCDGEPVCLDVPISLDGPLPGPLAGILFTVKLTGPWHLIGIRSEKEAEGLTLTMRKMAEEPDTATAGKAERYAVLLDGPSGRAYEAWQPGRVLVILTLTYRSSPSLSPGEAACGTEEQGILSLAPVEGDACVYAWTESGGLATRPLRGSEIPLTISGACEQNSQPEPGSESVHIPEPDTGQESGVGTEPDGEVSSDPDYNSQTDATHSFRYVGCQEAGYGDRLLSVRFLYLVPDSVAKTGIGTAFPSVWLTGGGTATLSVSCATSVEVWSSLSDCRRVAAPPGTQYLILTYTGLDVGRTYLFTLDTGAGLTHVVYEQGVYIKGRARAFETAPFAPLSKEGPSG